MTDSAQKALDEVFLTMCSTMNCMTGVERQEGRITLEQYNIIRAASTPSAEVQSLTDARAAMLVLADQRQRAIDEVQALRYCLKLLRNHTPVNSHQIEIIDESLNQPRTALQPLSLSDECISECRKHFKEYVDIEAAFFDDCVLLACKEILNLRDQVNKVPVSTPPVPIDTINIKKEVVEGVRDDIKNIDCEESCGHRFRCFRCEALASLDAVLEGKP